MKGYSYVAPREFGFAPNPFWGYCTLATCKPRIRQGAVIGDWIIVLGSKQNNLKGHLICLMRVDEKLSYSAYWNDPRFQTKKPIMNGSLVQMHGDNIYHKSNATWIQAHSHHSLEDGKVNIRNLRRDTQSDNVIVSSCYYYFGENCIKIPKNIFRHLHVQLGEKKIGKDHVKDLVEYVSGQYSTGRHGNPSEFEGFTYYDGK